jgi:hypothetical protein
MINAETAEFAEDSRVRLQLVIPVIGRFKPTPFIVSPAPEGGFCHAANGSARPE